MTDKTEPTLAPEEASRMLIEDVVAQVVETSQQKSLDGFDAIFDAMENIVAATGVEIPGNAEQIAALRAQTAKAQHHIENTDAATWAGDLERANRLIMAGPGLDHAALGIADLTEAEFEDDGYEVEEDSDLGAEEFAAMLAEMDLAPEDFEEDEILEDLYADIAGGKAGAIDAFIASGEDPNLPRGEARHTALLAALDAPGRRVEHLEQLAAAGADPKVIHVQGDNAISWAMGYHHPDTVTRESETALIAWLAGAGVDVDHVTTGFWTTLHRAIIQGGADRLAALLAAGATADTNAFAEFAPDKLAGATPLMLAGPKPDAVQVLLDHGADPAQPASDGRKTLEFLMAERDAAYTRATEDDPWTIDHAEALDTSIGLIERAGR